MSQICPADAPLALDNDAAYALTTYLLGARRTGPTTWAVSPALSGVTQASGALPLQNGVDAAERIGAVAGITHLIGGATWLSAAIESPGVPESFRVLVKELQSLGLAVEVVDAKEEVIQFGREVCLARRPRCGDCPLADRGPYPGRDAAR